jgi:hypothetical protein
MRRIQLTEEQSRILAEANEGENIEICDAQGQLVSFLKRFHPDDVKPFARHLQRRGLPKEPGIPSERVQAMLRRFEEIDRTEGMTREKTEEILRRVKAGEPI